MTTQLRTGVIAWVDASAGVAGDMLLAALLDAGAPSDDVRRCVDAVLPGGARLVTEAVRRGGLRALALHVEPGTADQPERTWATLRGLLERAALPDRVRARALAAFTALAEAEARVHGTTPEEVHFHEVGAWDSVADVVGTCAALEALGVTEVVAGELTLGSGSVRTAHGTLPVPVPAVLELCRGWSVTAGGDGELTTPTGAALVTTLATGRGPLPAMVVDRTGTGAGTRERPDRANVVRVVLGRRAGASPSSALLLETNVDDLDPRVWPTVVDDLLAAGALDAWLTPAVMKKGRPGHVLGVLATPEAAARLRRLVLDRTSALGVRQSVVEREVLERAWVDVDLILGGAGASRVAVKVGHREGAVVHATPEFAEVAALAAASGRGVREVLDAAAVAAAGAGIIPGAPLPARARPER